MLNGMDSFGEILCYQRPPIFFYTQIHIHIYECSWAWLLLEGFEAKSFMFKSTHMPSNRNPLCPSYWHQV